MIICTDQYRWTCLITQSLFFLCYPKLIKEGNRLADVYKNRSVAEQNSVDLAWELLMDEGFKDLRAVIYTTESERHHFRQLLVQLVMATGKR